MLGKMSFNKLLFLFHYFHTAKCFFTIFIQSKINILLMCPTWLWFFGTDSNENYAWNKIIKVKNTLIFFFADPYEVAFK